MKILLQSIKSGIVKLTNTNQIIKLNKTSFSNHFTVQKKHKSHLIPQQSAKAKSVTQKSSSTTILNNNNSITFKVVKRLLSSTVNNAEQIILPVAEEAAILTACREGNLERIKQLTTHLTSAEKRTHPALLEAIRYEQMEIVHYLLANNIGLRAIDVQGNTILHIVVKYGVRDGQQFLVEKLLTRGICDINGCINSLGESLLHTAIRYHQSEVVKSLIRHGIDLNLAAKTAWSPTELITPIQLAVVHGDKSLVQLLLENQVSVTSNNLPGKSLLDIAVWANQIHVLKYLLSQNHHRYQAENIQQAFFTAAQVGNIEALEHLASCRAGINQQDPQGNTALHLAVAARQITAVCKLLDLNAELSKLNSTYITPIELARQLSAEERNQSEPNHIIADTYERLRNILINCEQRRLYQRFTPPNYKFLRIKNLVFQGGGVKGLAYAGSLEALETQLNTQHSSLQNISRVAGTSAGAITAALVAVGYNPRQIRNILKELDLTQFLDHPAANQLLQLKKTTFLKGLKTFAELCIGYLSANPQKRQATPTAILRDLYQIQGLCSGEKFRVWMDDLLFKKTGIHNLTFGLLKELARRNQHFKSLHVVTTNLATSVPELISFNSEDEIFSHIGVADAVRASMSIPGVFKPKAITYRDQMGQEKNCYCVDGGLIRNFPIDIFDRAGYREGGLRKDQADYPVFNDQTLGFSLYSPSSDPLDAVTKESLIQKLRNQIAKLTLEIEDKDIANTHAFVKQLATVYFQAEQILNLLKSENAWRTAYVNNQDVNAIDFDLSEEQKEALIEAGRAAVEEFYQRQQQDPGSGGTEKNGHKTNGGKQEDSKKKEPQGPKPPEPKENKRHWLWGIGVVMIGAGGIVVGGTTREDYKKERSKLYKIESLCPYFVEESQKFKQLCQLFNQGAQLVVITGMGGIGKTNLAREYAKILYEGYRWFYRGKWQNIELENIKKGRPLKIMPPLIWEINGESFLSISQGLKALAQILELDEWHKDQTSEIKTPEDLKRLCHQLYAKSSIYPKVILLFDNVSTFKDKTNEQGELQTFGIEPYLPTPDIHLNVQVLITSRREDFLQETENYKLLKLDKHYFKKSAQTLWQKIVSISSTEKAAQQMLLEKLDYLPLAVSVMAHYSKKTGQQCGQILEKLTTDQHFLQSGTMQRIAESLPGYNQTIHAAFLLSIEPIRTNEKLVDAWELLILASYIANYDIKKTLLLDYLQLKYPTDNQLALERKLEVALNTFRDASLLTSNDSRHESYEIHLLLQKVIRSEHAQLSKNAVPDLPSELERLSLLLAKQLNVKQKERYTIWRDKFYLIQHSRTFLINLNSVFVNKFNLSLAITSLYNNLAIVLTELGGNSNLKEALKYHQQALTIRIKAQGEEHLHVATSYNNLAVVLQELEGEANFKIALKYYQQALAIRIDKLGKEHPDVAESYNNLAVVLSKLRGEANLEAALKYHQRALDIYRKQSGDEFIINVADSYNNLAAILQKLGGETNLNKALEYYQEALAIYLNKLNPEHIRIGMSYYNLATLLHDLGGETNLNKAYEYQQHALTIRIKTLGEEHPDVAKSYNNLVAVLDDLGGETYLKIACDYQRKALHIAEKKWGVNHEKTKMYRRNMAKLEESLAALENHKLTLR